MTILIVGVAIGTALLLYFVDNALHNIIDLIFRLLGLQSGKGPLTAEVVVDSEKTVLKIVNEGKQALKLVAIEGRDHSDVRVMPISYLSEQEFHAPTAEEIARKQVAKVSVKSAEVVLVFLKTPELVALDCRSLAILDSRGSVWPVKGYNIDTRKHSG